MKKIIAVLCFALIANMAFSQIRTNNPTASTISGQSTFLDASGNVFTGSTNNGKGLAFPRTDLTTFQFVSDGNFLSFPTRYDGMVVYNTGTGTTPATNSGVGGQTVEPGFYYFSNPTSATVNGGAGEWMPLGGSGTATAGTITALDCSPLSGLTALQSDPFFSSSSVTYTGGDEGSYFGAIVNSTGVTGLTASYAGGTFATAGGSINMIVQGTPTSAGVASFALSIGGQTCTVEINVYGVVTCAGTGQQWLDRNLGAQRVPTTKTDYLGYGDFYQYGRLADGHQVVDWTSSTTANLSPTTTTKVDYANVSNVGHGNFVVASTSPRGWIDHSTLPGTPWHNNDFLWISADGDINNPCPAGFSIPTQAELVAEHAHFTSPDNDGAFDSCLKLPAAGRRRSDGTSTWGIGTIGYVMVEASLATVQNGGYTTTDIVASTGFVYQSNGASSVRCIRD